MKKPLIAALIAILPLSLVAAEKPVRPDIAELMTLMEVNKQMEATMAGAKQMMLKSLPEKTNDIARKAAERGFDLATAEFKWDKISNDFAQIYAEVFTPEEVNALIGFYKSPIGQSLLKKTPVLMQKSMELTQKKMIEIMPKLQAQIQAEIEAEMKKTKESKQP